MRNRVLIATAMIGLLIQPGFASEVSDEAPIQLQQEVRGTAAAGSLAGQYLAARHASFTNDLASAAGFFRAALMRDPDNAELLDQVVRLYVASGGINRAAELADDLLKVDPENQAALLAKATAQVRARNTEDALATIDTVSQLGGPLTKLIAGLLKGWTLALDGHPAEGINHLDDLRGPSWYLSFTSYHAGLIADMAGFDAIAEDRLGLAYERDPSVVRIASAYARHLARKGETKRAIAVLDAFDQTMRGLDHFTAPLRDDIENGNVTPLAETPDEGISEAFYGIAAAVGNEASDTFSAGLYQLALHLSPGSYFPAMALGGILEGMDQHAAAIEVYRSIPRAHPLRRSAHVQEALNLNRLERHEESISILSRLVDADPTDISTAVALGNVHRILQDFENARTVYTTALDAMEAVPDAYWSLYYYRGITNERTKRWPEAEADFRKALEMEPDQPLVLNYLGYTYIDRGENLDEALEMVRSAVSQRPEDGYIVDSLGWAYYRLGRYDDAVRELERAVSLRPGDPTINDHLGDAYWKVGRKLEAMFQWAHARDADPEAEQLEIIERKLAEGLDAVEEAPEPGTAVANDSEGTADTQAQ